MPIEFIQFIHRPVIQANPDKVFVFADNAKRTGLGGQAAAARGEPNTIGIRTKFAPSRQPHAYFSDHAYDDCVKMIDEDLAGIHVALANGKTVVLPLTGFGNGLAELPTRAPKVNEYLVSELETICQAYGVPIADILALRYSEHPDVLIFRQPAPKPKKQDEYVVPATIRPVGVNWPDNDDDDEPPPKRVA